MSNKFREALIDALLEGFECGKAPFAGVAIPDRESAARSAKEIAQRYGDLEFTREEVREAMANSVAQALSDPAGMYDSIQIIDRILSRHLGEGEGTDKDSVSIPNVDFGPIFGDKTDDTPTIKASEIEAVTGEKVPEGSEWVGKEADGACVFFTHKPRRSPQSNIWTGSAWTGATPRNLIPGPWQDSLRRIIHDDKEHTLDREVGEIQGDLIALTKRIAAIEKRVLADKHRRGCELRQPKFVTDELPREPKCTCGHDEIREQTK